MLQAIREKAQGWIAWVIVFLISIPFALWGIQEYLGVGGEPLVVKINDREITERELDNAFHRFRMSLKDQLGDSYRPGLLDDQLLKRQVLASMIQQELLAQTALDQGMTVSDEMVQREIASVPIYQKGGRFDYETYQNALRMQGIGPEYLAQQIRAGMVIDQLSRMVEQTEFTTAMELRDSQRLRDQQRELGYLRFPKAKYLDQQELDEQQIKAFYDSHQADFKAPERVKLDYVLLSLDDLASQIAFTEQDLSDYLDQHREEFLLVEERRVSHILIANSDDEARQKAQGLLDQIRQGADFAELAKQNSDDPGSASQGGDLGFFGRGIMDPAFEAAAYALQVGEVSDLVQSGFGFHIIKLHEVRGSRDADLAAVRERVQQAYTREQARQQFDNHFERLANLAYEMPDSLVPIEEELGLKVQNSEWLTRAGGEGLLAEAKVIAAAFSQDVLEGGNNSEPLELAPDRVMVLRISTHELASTKPLEEVRPDVERALREQNAKQAAAAAGSAALAQLRAGKTLAEVADEAGVESSLPGLVKRFDNQLPIPLRNELYRLPRPAEGAISYGGVELTNGDYAVIALTRVVDGELADDATDLRQRLDRNRGGRAMEFFLGALEDQAKIEYLNQKLGAGD